MTCRARREELEAASEAAKRDRSLFAGPAARIPEHPETQLIAHARKRMHKAWRSVQYAIEKGRIERPAHCKFCDATDIEAHHLDYDNPLNIVWLCRRHHDVYTAKRPSPEPRRTRALLGY